MYNHRSRLTQQLESQTKKNLTLTVIAIAIIIGVLWKFGVPILTSVSYMLAGSKNEEKVTQKAAYIAPPTLDDTFDATNSARVNIQGSSLSSSQIELFVNNRSVDTTDVADKNTFVFENVSLQQGNNTIKARVVSRDGQKSNFSNILTVAYLNKAPELSLETPTDGQEFQKDNKNVEIKGKTDPGTRVTVNDFWAIVDDAGQYTYTLLLKDGDNDIKVIATDDAGNKTEKSIRVKYAP